MTYIYCKYYCSILLNARGIVFLTILKVGFMLSGRVGTGYFWVHLISLSLTHTHTHLSLFLISHFNYTHTHTQHTYTHHTPHTNYYLSIYLSTYLSIYLSIYQGLVINRLRDGSWSAPSAIGVSGVGWGFQVGTELSDVMVRS